MRTLRAVALALTGVGLFAAPAGGQWARLQRCAGALPCAIPYAVRYNPDPLIAAHYGHPAGTAVSARVSLEVRPEVVLDGPRLSRDPSEDAARRFLLAHPPPTPRPAPAPEKTPPPSR